MNFPRCLYKLGAKGIEYQQVDDAAALDAAVLEGWHLTRADALAPAEAVDLSETHSVEDGVATPRKGKGKGKAH